MLRRGHTDLIGWQISIIGTTYAVIVGFMLFAVWSNFELADVNAETEANCLVNLHRFAQALPPAQRSEVQKLTEDYADVMLNEEWPAMARVSTSANATRITQQLWKAVVEGEPRTASEQASLDHAMVQLTSMTEHRRVRQLQSEATLPWILWAVLIVGAAITIMSVCLFGSENTPLHLSLIVALALMLSLALVAIADINRPFQGAVHVMPRGFERAQQTFADYHAAGKAK